MTYTITGSTLAPTVFDAWPIDARSVFRVPRRADDQERLFGLCCAPTKRRLVCHWHREPDGRLACFWEPDIVPIPQR